MAAGIATPTTSSERFTEAGSSRSNASSVTASTLAPKLRVRSMDQPKSYIDAVMSAQTVRGVQGGS